MLETLDFIDLANYAKVSNKRISEFREGKIKIREINPNRINFYYPVLITCLDSIPCYDRLSEYYVRMMQQRGILQQRNVAPLTIITLNEFEKILQLIQRGQSFVEILKGKFSNREAKNSSMMNYLISNYQSIERPEHILENLNQLGNDVLQHVQHLKLTKNVSDGNDSVE